MQKLKDKIRGLSAQLANVDFTYRDPTRNFERSKVKGVVAKLIKIKDRSTMTALEVLVATFRVSSSLVIRKRLNFAICLMFLCVQLQFYISGCGWW